MEPLVCSPGIRLRPFSFDDISVALGWYADPVVLAGAISPSQVESLTPDYLRSMYADLASRGELFIIEVLRGAKGELDSTWIPVGEAMLSAVSMPIVIGESSFRGRGVARSVLQSLISRARAKGWPSLSLKGIYKGNVASQRLFESCGFVRVGENAKCFLYELKLAEQCESRLAEKEKGEQSARQFISL